MKKVTLLAAMAMVAGVAAAQYSVDPTVETVLANNTVGTVHYIALDEASLEAFEAQGATTIPMGPDGESRNLWVWVDTFTSGDSSYPGVGDHFDGYVSLNVGTSGWSGAGYNLVEPGANTTAWNDNTRFHLAYMSNGTACPSVALIIGDEDGANTPARVALGDAFNDNGTVYAAIAPASNDDWQGLDISFSDLKKISPSFAYDATESWCGNILSFLCGGVTGQNISLDAIYFYTPGESGVEGIAAENAAWSVTRNSVNFAGANAIALYDLSGKLVKKANGSVLSLNGVDAGLYIARSGKAATKVLVK